MRKTIFFCLDAVFGLVIWKIFRWFFDNLAFDALMQALESKFGIEEAKMLKPILDNVLPLLPAAFLVWLAWWLVFKKRVIPVDKNPSLTVAAPQADEYIPMREAATKAYEALRRTPWAEHADFAGPGETLEARRILYMANALKAPLYGKVPPSRQYEKIEGIDRPLMNNGETFSYRTRDNEYIDIAVKSDDLKTAIERMQTV